jgi:serine/threonine-protein kinase
MPEPVTGPYEPQHMPKTATPDTVAASTCAPTGGATPPLAVADTSVGESRRGRFTILKEHAHGGLGKVSVARDDKLRRQVALKEIRPEHGDNPHLRQRFLSEAEITGMLEHPGIVPIYQMDEDVDGRPFYAMRFIQGRNLAEAIREFHLGPSADSADDADKTAPPSVKSLKSVESAKSVDRFASLPFRNLLQRFVAVCNTIAYAHSKGVIHRDLKPANIMLGDYGETLVVDWGLAKRLSEPEASAREADGPSLTVGAPKELTQAGQLLGTPAYMSPEQAQGIEVGPAADIYALGAILYQLLTAQAPYHGHTIAEVLAQVKSGPPRPPTEVVKGVPKPLEAVCLKAMVRAPAKRYVTATDLAKDVDRWLADEAVSALRDSLGVLIGRWARKHRTLVASAVALLLTAVAGLAVGLAAVEHEREQTAWERDEKGKALVAETKAREAEKQALSQAMAGLRDVTDELVENQMARDTHLTEETKELLRKLLKHFEALAAITADDAESRSIRAEGYARVGMMRHRLGELKEAEAAYLQALALRTQLAEDFPTNPKFPRELAISQGNLGVLLSDTSRPKEAEAAYAQALAIRKQLNAEFPTDPDFREDLAKSYHNLGALFQVTGRLEEAEAAYSDAIATLQQEPSVDLRMRPSFRQVLASSHNNLGALFEATGQLTQAEAAYRHAFAVQKRLVNDYPRRAEYRQDLATTHNNLALLLKDMGRYTQAESAHSDALDLQKHLAAEFPTRPEFRQELARSFYNLGLLLQATARPKQAESAYSEALLLQKRLAYDFPTRHAFQAELASTHNDIALLLWDTDRLQEAEAAFTEALVIQRKLAADFPNQSDLRNSVGATLVNVGMLRIQGGHFLDAKDFLEEAAPHHHAALKANPKHPTYRQFYRNNLMALARANAGLLHEPGALKAAATLRDLGWNLPDNAYDAARALAQCVPIVEKLDKLDAMKRQAEAQFYADEAMKMLRDAVAKGFKDAARVKKESDLAPLRQREDFQKLLAELEGKR